MPQGAHDAEEIDAPVRLEVLVFNGDHSLAQHRRKAVVADHLAPLQREGADDPSLPVVKFGGSGGAVLLQILDLRQIGGVDQGEPGQRAGKDRQQQQNGQRGPAGEFATAPDRERRRGDPGLPALAARFQRLIGEDSQACQASRAFLKETGRKCYSLRLAFRRCERVCWRTGRDHRKQERERRLQGGN